MLLSGSRTSHIFSCDVGSFLVLAHLAHTIFSRFPCTDLSGGGCWEDQDVGTRGIAGCLQRAVTAHLLLHFDGLGHHPECGVGLHGHQTGTEDTGQVRAGQGLRRALGTHFPQVLAGVHQVLLTEQTTPT